MLGLPSNRFVVGFMSRIERRDDGCWEWVGFRDKNYGRFYAGDVRDHWAHRNSWRLANGRPIPKGLEIDHLCNFTFCVNPAHLEPVTHTENMRRASERRVPPEHGTVRRYWLGCRCESCVAANLAYGREITERARAAAAAGDIEIRHGTSDGYCRFACRCDLCRTAHSANVLAGRRRRGVQPQRVAEHGSISRYSSAKWSCRCDLCRAAWRDYWRAHRAKKREMAA